MLGVEISRLLTRKSTLLNKTSLIPKMKKEVKRTTCPKTPRSQQVGIYSRESHMIILIWMVINSHCPFWVALESLAIAAKKVPPPFRNPIAFIHIQ